MEPNDIDERTRLEALAAFVPRFRQSGAGKDGRTPMRAEVTPGEQAEMDTRGTWLASRDLLADFTKTAYETKWVISFDWSKWSDTSEGNSLLNDRTAVAAASSEQLSKLLTAIIRADRFSAGTLEHAFESGLLLVIAERAAVVVNTGH